jgi:hypothetical protein
MTTSDTAARLRAAVEEAEAALARLEGSKIGDQLEAALAVYSSRRALRQDAVERELAARAVRRREGADALGDAIAAAADAAEERRANDPLAEAFAEELAARTETSSTPAADEHADARRALFGNA